MFPKASFVYGKHGKMTSYYFHCKWFIRNKNNFYGHESNTKQTNYYYLYNFKVLDKEWPSNLVYSSTIFLLLKNNYLVVNGK